MHPVVPRGVGGDGDECGIHDGSRTIRLIRGRSSISRQYFRFEPDAPDGYRIPPRASDNHRSSRLVASVVELSAFECHFPGQTSFSKLRFIHGFVAESFGCGSRCHCREN